jgi:hypothetical protein
MLHDCTKHDHRDPDGDDTLLKQAHGAIGWYRRRPERAETMPAERDREADDRPRDVCANLEHAGAHRSRTPGGRSYDIAIARIGVPPTSGSSWRNSGLPAAQFRENTR